MDDKCINVCRYWDWDAGRCSSPDAPGNSDALCSFHLTPAQIKALRLIGQPGGHGIGDYSGIRRVTVEAMKKKGIPIKHKYKASGTQLMEWAYLDGDRYA